MDRFRDRLRGKKKVALQDQMTQGTVAELADVLSASSLTAPEAAEDPDGLGCKVWSEPSVDHGPLVDIVFVHGLTGKRTKTWLADGAAKPWPEELLSKKIPEARIVTYGYDADVVHFIKQAGQNTVREHAQNFVGDLTDLRRGTSSLQRPLIIVAHSLGGLLVEQAFVLSYHDYKEEHQLSDSFYGIVFLGTPHAGSDFTKFALSLGFLVNLVKSPNTSNIGVLEKDSEVLAGIQNSFGVAITKRAEIEKKHIEIYCCTEEKPLKGLSHRVVEPASAQFPGPHTSCTIPADHIGMTKFQNSSQVGYKRVSDRLRRWVDVIREDTILRNKYVAEHNGIFLMPFAQDKDFVSRRDIFKSLDKGFSQPATLRRMALAGLGGIGKSQIAIEYAYRLRETSPARSVFWVYANNSARFEQSYRSIATAAKIPGVEDPKADVLNLVYQWLGSDQSGDWLMILDNADDAQIFFSPHVIPTTHNDAAVIESPCLSSFLPQTGLGSIIITSRDEGTALRLTGLERKQVLQVDIMSEDDTMALLTKRLPEDPSDESAKRKLIAELDSIPLAITQASAYIKLRGKRMTIARYLEFLRSNEKNQIDLLSKNEMDLRRDPEVPNSIIRTWQISFSRIKEQNPAAAKLLSCMCMLDRQGIPEFLFYEDGVQSLRFLEAIETLINFSFVVEEKEKGNFEIHRLVQLATQKWLETFGTIQKAKEKALRLVSYHYPSGGYENWTTCEALEPHAQIVMGYTFDSENCKLQQKELLYNGAGFAFTRGKYKISEEKVTKAIEIGEKYLRPDDLSTLDSLHVLGLTYLHQGRWSQAEALYLRVIETRKEVLGDRHPDTLTSLNNLAMTYYRQGHYKKAEEMHIQVLDIKKQVLGPEHRDTLASMNNLASTYGDQQDLTKAEELLIQIVDTEKTVLGPKHPVTLRSMNNLASTYVRQGDLTEAEKLLIQIVDTAKRVLGPEHPDTLRSMNNLALTYGYQGHWSKAEKLNVQVLNTQKRILGAEHPNTLISMNNLAYTYHSQARHNQAIELMEQVVELFKKKLGANHPHTLASIDTLRDWKDE